MIRVPEHQLTGRGSSSRMEDWSEAALDCNKEPFVAPPMWRSLTAYAVNVAGGLVGAVDSKSRLTVVRALHDAVEAELNYVRCLDAPGGCSLRFRGLTFEGAPTAGDWRQDHFREFHDASRAAQALRLTDELAEFESARTSSFGSRGAVLRAWSTAFQCVFGEPDPGHEATENLRRLASAHLSGDPRTRELMYAHSMLIDATLGAVDVEVFNGAVAAALAEHRAVNCCDEAATNDHRGGLSLEVLAICCMAHDRGVSVEVESTYIPRWIIEKDWPPGATLPLSSDAGAP